MSKHKGRINFELLPQLNGVDLIIDHLDDVDTTTSAPSINDVLEWDGSNWVPVAPGGGVTLEDEGSTVTGGPHNTLNFTGDGVNVTDAGSGEATINVPQVELDGITVYDATGGQTFTGTITMNLDTTLTNTDGTLFSLAGDVVTVSFTGTVLLSYSVTLGNNGGSRSQGQAFIEVDTGGGFGEVLGTRCRSYHRNATQESTNMAASVILNVTTGDDFRVQVDQMSGGTLETLANHGQLTILRIK